MKTKIIFAWILTFFCITNAMPICAQPYYDDAYDNQAAPYYENPPYYDNDPYYDNVPYNGNGRPYRNRNCGCNGCSAVCWGTAAVIGAGAGALAGYLASDHHDHHKKDHKKEEKCGCVKKGPDSITFTTTSTFGSGIPPVGIVRLVVVTPDQEVFSTFDILAGTSGSITIPAKAPIGGYQVIIFAINDFLLMSPDSIVTTISLSSEGLVDTFFVPDGTYEASGTAADSLASFNWAYDPKADPSVPPTE
jgi:hypothetical protein